MLIFSIGSCSEESIEIIPDNSFYTLTDNLVKECCQCLNWHGYDVTPKEYTHTYANAVSVVNYYIELMEYYNIPFDDTVGEGNTYFEWYNLNKQYSNK